MDIKTVLGKIRNRQLSFLTFKAALHFYELPTGTGWAGIEEKLSDASLTAQARQKNLRTLQKLYEDNIYFGNKAVQICDVGRPNARYLEALLTHRFRPEFAPANAFPEPISAEDLRAITLKPQLVKAIADRDKRTVALYFYARGYETEKEQFDVDNMTDAVSKRRFAGYDHVIAYRQTPYLRIDSVHVDVQKCQIQFRVDKTRLASLDQIEKALTDLKAAFRAHMENSLDAVWAELPFVLLNFYPKIQAVYKHKDGKVVKLGHNTASGAINHEKMRGLKGDLREESYHKAGMSAVDTQSFSITTSFPYDNGYSRVYLSIPGKSAQVSVPNPKLETAIIDDCFREEQFTDMIHILR